MGVDKSGQRVQRMFGEIAGNYDRMNHLLSMQTDRYWRWRTARRTKPVGDAPILDVCTGTGDLAFALLRASGGKAPVVATDFCQPMLDIGRQKKIARGIDGQLEFMQADAQNLPFPDNHFQIVTVAFGLRNVADTDQGLREMTRVCQVGGRVAVLEFTMPRTPGIRQLYGWYFRTILPRLGHWLAGNTESAYEYLPESVGEFPSYEALAQRMREAGLSRVDFYPLTLGVATLYLGVK